LDLLGVQFELGDIKITLIRDKSDLAAIKVEFKELSSAVKYDEVMQIVNQLKPVGNKKIDEVGMIGPAGHITKNLQYSQAYVVRKERTCGENEESNCGIEKFSVFYWLPLKGLITNKRTEEISIKPLDYNQTKYFITVNSKELEVSETDFNALLLGQFTELERTIGSNNVRLASHVNSQYVTKKFK